MLSSVNNSPVFTAKIIPSKALSDGIHYAKNNTSLKFKSLFVQALESIKEDGSNDTFMLKYMIGINKNKKSLFSIGKIFRGVGTLRNGEVESFMPIINERGLKKPKGATSLYSVIDDYYTRHNKKLPEHGKEYLRMENAEHSFIFSREGKEEVVESLRKEVEELLNHKLDNIV